MEPESSQPQATSLKADKYYLHIQADERPKRKKTYDICMAGCGITFFFFNSVLIKVHFSYIFAITEQATKLKFKKEEGGEDILIQF